MPAGKGEVVVIVGGAAAGFIVIESALDDVCAAVSVTCIVKFELTVAVGVPLIVPEEESIKPAGSNPEIKDQE